MFKGLFSFLKSWRKPQGGVYHTGGVVGLKAGEVPAILSPEFVVPLKSGESQAVADEIAAIKAKTAKAKAAHIKKLADSAADRARREASLARHFERVDAYTQEALF